MTLTTAEAAERVGVAVRTIRLWVERGYLAPCNRREGRRMTWEARFIEAEVIECAHDRKPQTWHVRLDTLARDVFGG
jgi:excisionase family DNA binding protein